MIFFTKYIRPSREVRGEINNGKELVEKGGYIQPDSMIKRLLIAGARLDAFREAGGYEFQPGEEIPDDYFDPTRSLGYDLVDADRDMQRQREIIDRKLEARKAAKKDVETPPAESRPGGSESAAVPAHDGA